MARVKVMKTIVTDRRQPHSPLDNVNTPYNPIRQVTQWYANLEFGCCASFQAFILSCLFRLLKGSPPGQEAVNRYISELSIEKKHNSKLADKQRKHLVMLEVTEWLLICFTEVFASGLRGRVWLPPQAVRPGRGGPRHEVPRAPAGAGLRKPDQTVLTVRVLSTLLQ